MFQPLISVIIPVYNVSSYLSRCINSIINQSYPSLEVILIDDGSTDGSGSICDEYEAKHHSVKAVHTSNNGASYARLKGLELACGKYVTFIDSDDWIELDYIEKLYAALVGQGTLIAACDYIKHPEEESPSINRNTQSRLLDTQELHHRFFHYDFWGFWGKIYDKSVFDDIYFPKATINEDYVVMAQLFHKCKRIAYIDIPLYHYVIHGDSLSNSRIPSRMMDEWTNKLWCYRFYRQQAPEWERQAEAQAAETCCKLIGIIHNMDEYKKEKHEMQQFLQQHCWSLWKNREFLWGLKLMIVYRMLQ